ncbi:MAG: hypothetical protein KatS3mg026_0328 [Bacteroidia bacterium]|nr:MAG: hypothetical protein KatS3mg026_0328 [Bacteroidia bacterium]
MSWLPFHRPHACVGWNRIGNLRQEKTLPCLQVKLLDKRALGLRQRTQSDGHELLRWVGTKGRKYKGTIAESLSGSSTGSTSAAQAATHGHRIWGT